MLDVLTGVAPVEPRLLVEPVLKVLVCPDAAFGSGVGVETPLAALFDGGVVTGDFFF